MGRSIHISFLAYFLLWADRMGWTVPRLHLRVCAWLDRTRRARLRVLMLPRGCAKSTLVAIYEAHEIDATGTHRCLVQSADNKTALKLSKDTQHVMRHHPAAAGTLSDQRQGSTGWWAAGNPDVRNPSMAAQGVLSNVTSSRADEVVFDDVEVPKNIKTADSRALLRARLDEATHILVPGGGKLYVGTPHTHDSLYDEQIAAGAEVLRIPLFSQHVRYDDAITSRQRHFPFRWRARDLHVVIGIGTAARLLVEGVDYQLQRNAVVFQSSPGVLLDIYDDCAWPERFTREEILFRRRECRTLNAWDSQYQLEAKPVHLVRLDPDRMIAYAAEPVIAEANGEIRMMLGKVRIVSAAAWWDCALGKLRGDDSAFSVLLTDEAGQLYWHEARALKGDIYQQCDEIRAIALALQLPGVTVETNGPGGFVPPILRKTLAGTGCGVREVHTQGNKNKRILDGFEPPLSGRFLWAHTRVLEVVEAQMRDWRADVADQPDDFLDSGAEAIKQTPVRIGRIIGRVTELPRQDWRSAGPVHEVTVEYASSRR